MVRNYNPIIKGFLATAGLLGFYFILMRLLAGSWYAAYSQFEKLWYLMMPLGTGFGIQVGLYVYIKEKSKNFSTPLMKANTTSSTVAMIACCAHHLTDVLPFIGLTFISTLLVTYQSPILIVAVISNLFGIFYLLRTLKN